MDRSCISNTLITLTIDKYYIVENISFIIVVAMSDLDEVLERDSDGKINWLVAKVNDIDTRVHTIETNHLFHIEKDMSMIRNSIYLLGIIGITYLTGVQLL